MTPNQISPGSSSQGSSISGSGIRIGILLEDTPRPYQVYRNLHKQCWSVLYKGKVIAHPKRLTLSNVKWVVQPGGNARVRQEGRKNVHAFARCADWYEHHRANSQDSWNGIYNPYQHTQFMLKATSCPIAYSTWANMTPAGRAFAIGSQDTFLTDVR